MKKKGGRKGPFVLAECHWKVKMLKMEKKVKVINCWNCREATPIGSLCEKCGSVQPIPFDTDYFSIFGLPHKLLLDSQILEQTFHQLSRDFHPDFFHSKTGKEKRISLDNSAYLNKAYRTLKDPIERVEYLLNLEKRPVDQNQAKPPAELFEEIFEIQDRIEEFRQSNQNRTHQKEELEQKLQEDKKRLEGKKEDLEAKLKKHFSSWDEMTADDHAKENQNRKTQLLNDMRNILSDRSYLNTMIRDLNKALGS